MSETTELIKIYATKLKGLSTPALIERIKRRSPKTEIEEIEWKELCNRIGHKPGGLPLWVKLLLTLCTVLGLYMIAILVYLLIKLA